jgi:hypothetical protein
MRHEDQYGGDPPCWAHLFEEDAAGGGEDHPPAASSSPAPDHAVMDRVPRGLPVPDQKGVSPGDDARGEQS